MHKNEIETKDKDDTLRDILASAAFDKYPSDFESKYPYVYRAIFPLRITFLV